MVAQSIGKKRKLGVLSGTLAKAICAVGLAAMLASCGSSDGYSYSVGGTVSGLAGSGLVLQNNGGDDLSISTSGSFTFTKAVANESGYAVTIKTQPRAFSQTCTVTNGSGTVNKSPIGSVMVSCVTLSPRFVVDPLGKFAYAANYSSNSISVYKIETTGALTAGTPVAAGSNPAAVTIIPSTAALSGNSGGNPILPKVINEAFS